MTSDDTTIEREFPELAAVLRADAPEPAGPFAERLACRVRDGFPRKRRPLPRARTLAVAGAAACLVGGIAVALSLQGEDDLRLGSSLSSDGASTQPGPAPAGRTARGVAADNIDRLALQAPAPGRRAIERSASLTLAAAGDELDGVADRVVAVTDRYRGFVERSSVTTGDEEASGGTFDLRIPATRLRPALRDLSALAHVRSRTQAGDDVTRELSAIRERLQTARAERRSLLRRLEGATTDAQADAIRRRLGLVAGQLRTSRRELRDARLRTAYATVSVSLVKEDDGGAATGSLDGAIHDSLASMTGALGLTLRALGVAIPLILLALVAWLSGRTLLRRRREAALG